ncbi:MAG: hypothetical protein HRT44_08765, partial [Bdellovibrionales bacterium]|nr:hypothetical protein [Bdellovibrionales bacterium]
MAKVLGAVLVSLFSLKLMAADQIINCGAVVEMVSGLPNCMSLTTAQECYNANANGDLFQPWFEVAL